jgi:hypothetical protein
MPLLGLTVNALADIRGVFFSRRSLVVGWLVCCCWVSELTKQAPALKLNGLIIANRPFF